MPGSGAAIVTDAFPIDVRAADPSLVEARHLVDELWEELGVLYGDMGLCKFQPSDIQGPGAAFVIARFDGRAVGCGAVRAYDSSARKIGEIKRMFVRPAARGRGIARTILKTLEETALTIGYDVVRLESGVRQPFAIKLYETAGYYRIPPYGQLADDPLSIFSKSGCALIHKRKITSADSGAFSFLSPSLRYPEQGRQIMRDWRRRFLD
ncbi:MAG: hypothetical protein QOI34_4 [Verrucomicrobiota bacterium]